MKARGRFEVCMMSLSNRISVKSLASGISVRSVHYKTSPSRYPKVNVKDVELNKPRYGFRKIRPPILAQAKTRTLFPNSELAKLYIEEGKRIPNRFMSQMDSERALAQFNYFQEKLAMDEPHFTLGKKEVFLPSGRICLLRPNAKHTPYQAKFLVPKKMNKIDLRDYLWNIYGLRALNITVQLQPARWVRNPDDLGRHRQPQLKKMTVDMPEPFIWPEVPQAKVDELNNQMDNTEEIARRNVASGSDKKKPLEAYGGMYKEKHQINKFIPRQFLKNSKKSMKILEKKINSPETRSQVSNFLKL
ncbi:MRP20 [Candida oxycetoniae]|uniref:Large ribosomal subunit protein uL23m n=1 Tax=Candida oxycetoniae TaxID=497107 RepID=A0AAI9SXR2_9ASCO|nr:MRP20 [Candida oxycetoniae]KAI3404688.2 MRP20 [Candida oxycetoniae]